MRIVFMGTPAFAVPSLASLIANGHDVVAVYTQPPRRSGRGQRETPSPVHEFAQQHGLDARHPIDFKQQSDRDAFASLEADIGVVVAYGLLLPTSVLDAPGLGCINLHGSLLPRWRGAAPIQRAIMAGDSVTGVQVMQMEKGLDTGPILLSELIPISDQDTSASLSERMAEIGATLLPRALAALARDSIAPQEQAAEGVTYARKIDSAEAHVDWDNPATEVDQHIRGLSPFPGAWCTATREGKPVRLKLLLSCVHEGPDAPAGTVVQAGPEGIDVACGDGIVRLLRLQRPGKAAQSPQNLLNGWPVSVGERFQ